MRMKVMDCFLLMAKGLMGGSSKLKFYLKYLTRLQPLGTHDLFNLLYKYQ